MPGSSCEGRVPGVLPTWRGLALSRVFLPASSGIVQDVERGDIGPVHIIKEQHERFTFGQCLQEAHDGFKQADMCRCFVKGG